MTKGKKKLSKNAKAALKILEESKLLATAKSINDSNAARNFKQMDSPAKTSSANKLRPEKKRG